MFMYSEQSMHIVPVKLNAAENSISYASQIYLMQ